MSNLYSEKDRRYKYKYEVTTLNILIGEDTISLPPIRISDIEITHDYTKNLFPIFRFTVVLEPSVYYKILRNKNDVQFKIRLQKYYSEIGSEKKSLYRDVINSTFTLILDDDDYYAEEALLEKEAEINFEDVIKDDKENLYKADNIIEFFLFKTSMIKSSRKAVNTVLKNATTADAVGYIATKANFPKILMAPTDNKIEYKELVIPPMTAVEALKFIDSYYGFYQKGSKIYFDFDRCYILPYVGDCKAWIKDEKRETVIIIPSKTSAYASDMCSLMKKSDDRCNYIISSTYTLPRNNSNSEGVLIGNQIVSVDANTGKIGEAEIGGDSIVDRITVLDNRTENPYFTKIFQAQSTTEGTVLEIFIADYDIDAIRPNKKVTLIFEDTKYTQKFKGTYLIASVNHLFTKDGGSFKLSSKLVIKQSSK